jgi:ribosomal protein L2
MKLSYTPFLVNKTTTSGASRAKKTYSFRSTILIKYKKLFKYSSWKAGRTSSGRIVTLSKGRRILTSRTSQLNRSYRDISISFIGGFTANPYSKTLAAIVFSGSGSVTAIPSTDSYKVLSLTSLKTIFYKKSNALSLALMLKKYLAINSMFFLVLQLPRHSHVSNLEVLPTKGATLSRSAGSSSKLIKIDPRTSLSLVKLPSGVKKVISIFSVGSLGKPSLSESRSLNVTSAASSLKCGKAPRSRGIAKNPVDHPHGGRTKAIRYPRTPWGKTTKYK